MFRKMFKKMLRAMASGLIAFSTMGSAGGLEASTGASTLVRRIAVDVIDTARTDSKIRQGDPKHIFALVEDKVMPYVDFEAVTRSAVGPKWREATPEQRSRLQAEFKTLLIHVYAGALSQVRNQTVAIVRTVPVAGGAQQVVQTEVRGNGEPIQLDYRLDQISGSPEWKIIDVGVAGIWLVQSYRSQFAQPLTKSGLDGLLAALVDRNQRNARK